MKNPLKFIQAVKQEAF